MQLVLWENDTGEMWGPPLRRFEVQFFDANDKTHVRYVEAHMVFNNTSRGEGHLFRRYYDNSVKTEVVAEFFNVISITEVSHGQSARKNRR